MDTGKWYDVFESLQFPHNQGPVCCPYLSVYSLPILLQLRTPRTRVRYIKMVPSLLSRKFCTRFVRYPISELRDLSLEFAGLVFGIDPVEDVLFIVLFQISISISIFKEMYISSQP
jgi:hypothetical protein